MKTRFLLFVLFISKCFLANSQEDSIDQRIILFGDAGQLTNAKHPVVDAVLKTFRVISRLDWS